MAFKKSVEFRVSNQLVTPMGSSEFGSSTKTVTCYLKIINVDGGKELLTVRVLTSDFEDRSKDYDTQSFAFVPSVDEGSENYHKQGYKYLKTLPEFTGVIDILEQ